MPDGRESCDLHYKETGDLMFDKIIETKIAPDGTVEVKRKTQ
jgi:hypothetical protein